MVWMMDRARGQWIRSLGLRHDIEYILVHSPFPLFPIKE